MATTMRRNRPSAAQPDNVSVLALSVEADIDATMIEPVCGGGVPSQLSDAIGFSCRFDRHR
jgi:hypothetical protein